MCVMHSDDSSVKQQRAHLRPSCRYRPGHTKTRPACIKSLTSSFAADCAARRPRSESYEALACVAILLGLPLVDTERAVLTQLRAQLRAVLMAGR